MSTLVQCSCTTDGQMPPRGVHPGCPRQVKSGFCQQRRWEREPCWEEVRLTGPLFPSAGSHQGGVTSGKTRPPGRAVSDWGTFPFSLPACPSTWEGLALPLAAQAASQWMRLCAPSCWGDRGPGLAPGLLLLPSTAPAACCLQGLCPESLARLRTKAPAPPATAWAL